jgi:hypothetical protein
VTTTEAVPAVPGGATAFILVDDEMVKLAALPANVTAVAPLKFEPVTMTVFPPDTGPDAGETTVTMGVGAAV